MGYIIHGSVLIPGSLLRSQDTPQRSSARPARLSTKDVFNSNLTDKDDALAWNCQLQVFIIPIIFVTINMSSPALSRVDVDPTYLRGLVLASITCIGNPRDSLELRFRFLPAPMASSRAMCLVRCIIPVTRFEELPSLSRRTRPMTTACHCCCPPHVHCTHFESRTSREETTVASLQAS